MSSIESTKVEILYMDLRSVDEIEELIYKSRNFIYGFEQCQDCGTKYIYKSRNFIYGFEGDGKKITL